MADDQPSLPPEPELSASGTADSRVRYRVLAFTVALAGITYLDRVCIAQTAGEMMRDLSLTKKQMGFVFGAFILAYALFEMPTGAWGDRIGTRRLLTRIVAWWSTFTMATAAAFNYASLLAVRFLFGMGEAGAFPNVSKTFSRWFPLAERGTAQGVFFAGAHLGGGLTPPLVAVLLQLMPWRMVFLMFGTIGFLWAVAWHRWFRDDPADHPQVSQVELTLIRKGRQKECHEPLDLTTLRQILSHRNMIVLCLMYFTQAYGFYFNLTWLPTYLKEARGFSLASSGLLAGLPLVLSSGADLLGGLTTDRLTRRWGLRLGRCGVGFASLVLAGVTLIAGARAEDPMLAAVLIAISGAADSFLLGAAWGTCLDIAGPHAGLVTGTMNTAGQLGAFLSPILLPYMIGDAAGHQDWALPLLVAGGLYFAGACCWLFVNPDQAILENPDKAANPLEASDFIC